MEWIKCSERKPITCRLVLLFVDGDYEFGHWREHEGDYYIYTNGEFKKRYAFSEVTHFSNLNHPTE